MSIATPIQEHARYCLQPDHKVWYSSGDVRVCEHGRTQVGYSVVGVTSAYFRDLSPLFNPILWRRAKRLIAQGLPERRPFLETYRAPDMAFYKPTEGVHP